MEIMSEEQSTSSHISDLLRKAQQGNAEAQRSLGMLYAKGEGVPQSDANARYWYEQVAVQKDIDIRVLEDLAYLYMEEDGIPENQEKGIEWCKRAAAQGSTWAMCYLAAIYALSYDNDKARYWYEQAAAHGDIDDDSLIELAHLYYIDDHVHNNCKKALKWYKQAAKRGNLRAMVRVGDLYADGCGGVWHSFRRAEEWYQRAAAEGDDEAMYNLGFLCTESEEYDTAKEWWEQAAAAGNAEAMRGLGELYAEGLGVLQDYEKARSWWEQAAAAGNQKAVTYLTDLEKNIKTMDDAA